MAPWQEQKRITLCPLSPAPPPHGICVKSEARSALKLRFGTGRNIAKEVLLCGATPIAKIKTLLMCGVAYVRVEGMGAKVLAQILLLSRSMQHHYKRCLRPGIPQKFPKTSNQPSEASLLPAALDLDTSCNPTHLCCISVITSPALKPLCLD
ncbi:hypothetical protein CRENBAI_013336, partial [Crenichthys baileyi]